MPHLPLTGEGGVRCITCVPLNWQVCLVFVTCVHKKVVLDMESCGMSCTGCVVHVVVYGQWIVLWVAVTLLQLSVRLASVICRSCGVQGQC